MNILLISRPGLRLLKTLHDSETAWDAVRFYGPVELTVGVLIQVSTVAGAISLASDLRYFLRRYTADHLFQMRPGIYFTPALAKNRYLTRTEVISDDWKYRLMYWIENGGKILRCKSHEWNSEEVLYGCLDLQDPAEDLRAAASGIPGPDGQNGVGDEMTGGYLLEVWCTRSEYEVI
jgi:hypothetical protein